jgi:hypothetical protein
MSKGQRAMLGAKICSRLEQTKRETASQLGLHVGRVGEASTILEHADDLVDAVIGGSKPFYDAYAEAQKRKEAKQSDEFKIARLRRLPEFANQAHTPFKR